jgi:hypothetical protein
MSMKDYKMLIPDGSMTVEKLMKLLDGNELANFDPVREAFKVRERKWVSIYCATFINQLCCLVFFERADL